MADAVDTPDRYSLIGFSNWYQHHNGIANSEKFSQLRAARKEMG